MSVTPYATVTAPRTTTPRDTSRFASFREPEVEEHRAQTQHRVRRDDDRNVHLDHEHDRVRDVVQDLRVRPEPADLFDHEVVRDHVDRHEHQQRDAGERGDPPPPRAVDAGGLGRGRDRHQPLPTMCSVAPSSRIAPNVMSDQNSAFCRSAAMPGPDQRDAEAVQPVEQQTEQQEHVEAEEHGRRRQLEEAVPRALPAEEHREHGEVEVEVERESERGEPVEREGPMAGAPSPDVEPRGGSGRLPQDRAARSARGTGSPSRSSSGGLTSRPLPLVSVRRSCMIRCAGRTLDGHASVHSNAAWHRHAALSSSAHSRIGPTSAPRGSSSMRWAYASAAGPTYVSSVAATGQADRHRPHSMQSSNRSYASIPSGTSRGRREVARPRRADAAPGTVRRTTSCRRPGRSTPGSWPSAPPSPGPGRGRPGA